MKWNLHPATEDSYRTEERTLLLKELERTQNVIETAQENFNEAKDPALVDSYIYEIKAAQMRYQFLLKRVKQIT